MDIEKSENEAVSSCGKFQRQKKKSKERPTKNETLRLRLTRDEKKILLEQAKQFNISLSEYSLKRLFSRQVIVKTINGDNQNLRMELNRIGTNLNQLVHILHMYFDKETIETIKETIEKIKILIYQDQ